jgi:hypothetical protein
MDANTYYKKKHAHCLKLSEALSAAYRTFTLLHSLEEKMHRGGDGEDEDVRLIGIDLLAVIEAVDGLTTAVEPMASAASRSSVQSTQA